MIRFIFLLAAGFLFPCGIQAQVSNGDVTQVHVIFKTHLDIGFTDLSSVVERQYAQEFIPKAMEVADAFRAAGGEERYVWTTGAWLVASFLDQADEKQKERFEKAIQQGDIVWNGMPYTVESESMGKSHFETILKLSQQLDKRYGKKTTGAKMTDVPGHTRSIVPLLAEAGIRLLHIGVNPASTVPAVPPICRWQHPDGHEIILMYEEEYGSAIVLPDGKTVVSFAFTNDNHGPHTVGQVKQIYASLHERYPNAKIQASSLNEVVPLLEGMKSSLPVLKSEIGDTWIYGYGSSPLRMARFRAVSRLYGQWVAEGKIDPSSEQAVRFAVRLGMIAEHTWGVDVKSHIGNWDKYAFDTFTAARQLPEFKKAELSWKELSDNVEQAIAFLPEDLRQEALRHLAAIDHPTPPQVKEGQKASGLAADGTRTMKHKGMEVTSGLLAYQAFSQSDYERYFKSYMTHPYGWAFADFGKPGLEKLPTRSLTLEPVVIASDESKQKHGKRVSCRLAFPKTEGFDSRVLPEDIWSDYTVDTKKGTAEIRVGWVKKPANRLPEAYWFSFYPKNVVAILAEKVGCGVDVTDVVEGGNRQLHGIDRHVDIKTTGGTIRITSLDAPLMAVGERNLLNYSTRQADISQGVHFCLFNNAWGTNFTQWFEGDMAYRFKVEFLD